VGTLLGIMRLMWNCITELQELAVCHPINIRLSGQQTEYIINNSKTELFCRCNFSAFTRENCAAAETVECYVLLNASKISKRLYKIRTMKIYFEQSDEYEWPVLNENACGMCYTSGTGFAKGFCIPIALLIYMLQILSL
jgi:fatty-acyl-CoA synthase